MAGLNLGLVDLLLLAAVASLAVSGALAATVSRMGLAACCLVAAATGLAGGALLDALLGEPAFWVAIPVYPAACLAAAGLVWAMGARPWREAALVWFDAAGSAAYAAAGAATAAEAGASPLAVVVLGVAAAVAGGVARDLLAGRPVMALGRELPVAAVAAGALLFVVLRLAQVDETASVAAAAALAFGLRGAAIRFGLSLPVGGSPDEDA